MVINPGLVSLMAEITSNVVGLVMTRIGAITHPGIVAAVAIHHMVVTAMGNVPVVSCLGRGSHRQGRQQG